MTTPALTRQQLCAALTISESTVRRLEIDGMPYTPVGIRAKRYDLDECKQWLREQAEAEERMNMEDDAARYRWLRKNSGYTIRCDLFGEVWPHEHKDGDLDALIDAQILPMQAIKTRTTL